MTAQLSRRHMLSAAALTALAAAGAPLLADPVALAAEGSDLYFIKSNDTGQGKIEVHALTAASNYTSFSRHNITTLTNGERNNGTFHMVGEDLYFIKTNNTGQGKIEVHALTAASNYTSFSRHNITTLTNGERNNGTFHMVGEDLYFIKTNNTGQGKIEVHALTAASNYTSFSRHNITTLTNGERNNGTFHMVGEDLYFIKTNNTGQGKIEVHALTAASNYTSFSRHNITTLTNGERNNGTFWVSSSARSAAASAPAGRLNARIIAAAQAYPNGAVGGQCAAWVQTVIRAAGGTPVYLENFPWGYNASWAKICTEVVGWHNVQPGDICQWVYPDIASGHTAIITAGGSEATAQVIDSNYGYGERVNRGSFASRNTGGYYKIWRLK
ncbi:CHAP domain-containing protein [Actinomyces ruminicola]|uniref:CHAP domain-containing protein n=1 Tax=Actinomyces ruminicola TaxID=332524 RepID=UPI0011CC7BBE|nr:CHAP domain-containing protein [Actinomyces ruminicola]